MSEIAESIGSGGATMTAPSSPSGGGENMNSFSSRDLGMFRFGESQPKSMVSLDHGKEKNAPFARSSSFEKIAQDSKSMFDISKPVEKDPFVPFEAKQDEAKQKSHEEQLTNLFGEKMNYTEPPVVERPVNNFNTFIKNSTVLWEKPKESTPVTEPDRNGLTEHILEVENQTSHNQPVQEVQKEHFEEQMTPRQNEITEEEHQNAGATSQHVSEAETVENQENEVIQNPEQNREQTAHAGTNHYERMYIPTQRQNSERKTEAIISPLTQKPQLDELPAIPQPIITRVEQYEAAEQTVLQVKEAVRLMPDTEGITITVPQMSVEAEPRTSTQVMNVEALEEMIKTDTIAGVKTQLAKETQTSTESHVRQQTATHENKTAVDVPAESKTEATPQNHSTDEIAPAQSSVTQDVNENTAIPKQERKLRIEKAWFVKDIDANKNRRWEVIKAYASVHYKWIRQYISRMEGADVARMVQNTREREKLESASIKRIERDGSVDPYATILEKVGEMESLKDLDAYIKDAEEQFTATNFTSHPEEQIVDGEQILSVHNDQEIFQANLDGEEVIVLAQGVRNAKQPEFVRVEVDN